VLFWSEDDRDPFASLQGFGHHRRELIERRDGLFRLAMGQGAGPKDKGTIANSLGQ
jgi:hypothetical protein